MCQDCDDDRYDEYKDDLAMDRIWADGSYREPSDEPDDDPFSDLNIAHAAEYHRYLEHRERKHGGEECDCRPPWWRRAWWWLAGARRRWRFSDARHRIDVRLHPDRYDDEPPF